MTLPNSAKAARAIGVKFFFTGKPCVHGHIAQRYVSGSCAECKAIDRVKNSKENAKYARAWRVENPEKCKEYHEEAKAAGCGKDYYRRNREKEIKSAMEWRAQNLERAKETARNWYKKNQEWCRERAKRYNKNAVILSAKYRAADPEKYRARTRAWRKKYPDRARVSDANKKAMRKRAEGKFTRADVEKLMSLQKSKCIYCPRSLKKKFHIDHIHPLSKGGSNWPSNLQLLCEPCNLHKHTTDPIVFAQRLGRLL